MARAALSGRTVAVTGRTPAAIKAELSRGGRCSAVQRPAARAESAAPCNLRAFLCNAVDSTGECKQKISRVARRQRDVKAGFRTEEQCSIKMPVSFSDTVGRLCRTRLADLPGGRSHLSDCRFSSSPWKRTGGGGRSDTHSEANRV